MSSLRLACQAHGAAVLYAALCFVFLSKLFFIGQEEYAGKGRCLPMTMIHHPSESTVPSLALLLTLT